MEKFREFKSEKRTIILVSHALDLVKEFCEKTVLLSNGEPIATGSTTHVIDEYLGRVGK